MVPWKPRVKIQEKKDEDNPESTIRVTKWRHKKWKDPEAYQAHKLKDAERKRIA